MLRTLPKFEERKNMTVPEIIRKWPRMVLAFLEREGYFDLEVPAPVILSILL